MNEQGAISALRERITRTEVEVMHQSERLREHSERLRALSAHLTIIERRLDSIERLLRVMHNITRWGLASVGTMMLEAMTGTLRSLLKLLTSAGSGS